MEHACYIIKLLVVIFLLQVTNFCRAGDPLPSSEPFPLRDGRYFLAATVATDENDGFRALRLSCVYNNVPLRWLKPDGAWEGVAQKIALMKSFLRELSSDPRYPANKTIVMFVDGYDTMFQADVEAIVEKYDHLVARKEQQVLFGAEKECWPDDGDANRFPDSPEGSPYKFLNSGAYIGTVSAISDLIENTPLELASGDDQRYFAAAMLANLGTDQNRVVLDYKVELVFNLHAVEYEWAMSNEKIIATVFNTTPALLHGNSPLGKNLLINFYNYVPVEGGYNAIYGPPLRYINTESPQPLILVAVYHNNDYLVEEFAEALYLLRYPRNRIILYLFTEDDAVPDQLLPQNTTEFSTFRIRTGCTEELARTIVADHAKQYKECQYILWVTSRALLTEPDTLYRLLETRVKAVAPALRSPNCTHRNFWMRTSYNGQYIPTWDEDEICRRTKRGVWSVAYIDGAVLIHRSLFSDAEYRKMHKNNEWNWFQRNPTLAWNFNVRETNNLLHVDNTADYGFWFHS